MQKTILIVEDIELNREILVEAFKEEYRILEAQNGLEALQILSEEKNEVAIIILDVYMPVMNGFEVLERIRKNRTLEKIPVIVATELNDKESEIKALELGAVDFIGKPYNIRLIKQRVQNMIFMTENISYRKMTELDLLTGLYNRETFYRKTKEMLRENKEQEFDIYCLNIDRFKIINDLFGTNEGDNLLNYLAEGIKKAVPKNSIFGRLSADNFAICSVRNDDCGAEFMKKINEDIKKYSLNIEIIIRLGCYQIGDMNLPVHVMCDRANLAISSIKESYSKRIGIYNENMRNFILKEQEIIDDMNDALIKNQFVVYYQPKINMVTEKIIGSEALVRWIHPEKGIISPGIFIPIFEKNGFIATLDKHVWKLVCMDIRKALDMGLVVCPISVNVSRAELYNNDLCDVLIEMLNKYNVPMKLLQLEITESAYTEDPKQLIEIVNSLREKGFVILMDDFGSGYSSLNILKDIPIDILKIDLKFLYNMDHNVKANHILKSIVQMAKRLNLAVIAEGVETKQQADFLKSIGCIKAQGYLYSKPVPKEDFRKLKFELDNSGEEDTGSLVNIDSVLSKVYIEGEVEWYRSAVMQLKAIISEYDINSDTLVIFDKSLNDNKNLFEKIEIPNFMNFLDSGKYVHRADIEKYKDYFFSEEENVRDIRIYDLKKSGEFNWYETAKRVFFDDDEARYIVSVFRNINKEKINALIIELFKIFSQNNSYQNIFKNVFSKVSDVLLIDKIDTILWDSKNFQNSKRYLWDNKNGKLNETSLDYYKCKAKNLDLHKIENDNLLIYYKGDECCENIKKYFEAENPEAVAMKIVKVNEFYRIFMIYSFNQKRRKFNDFEKESLNSISLCLSSYIEREYALRKMRESLSLYQVILSRTSLVFWEYEIATKRIYHITSNFEEENGYKCIENVPETFIESGFIHEDFKDAYLKLYEDIKNGKDCLCICKIRKKDGFYKWCKFSYKVIPDQNGNPIKAVGVGEDINDVYKLPLLSKNDDNYKNFMEENSIMIFEANISEDVVTNVYIKPKAISEILNGCVYSDVIKKISEKYISPKFKEYFTTKFSFENLMQCYINEKRTLYFEFLSNIEKEEYHWLEAIVNLRFCENMSQLSCFVYIKDIDEKKKHEFELEKRAEIDFLTKMYNRETFIMMVKKYIMENAKSFYAFVIIDVDNFKNVNDSFGHAYGDEVLKCIADTIHSYTRSSTIVGRIGGDEFAVFVGECDSRDNMLVKAEVLVKKLVTDYLSDGKKQRLSCSMGIAFSENTNKTFDELYRNADKALYAAKRKGKACFCVWEGEE